MRLALRHPNLLWIPGRADQFSNLGGTGILPVAEKHGQDARTTANRVTQLEQLIVAGILADYFPPCRNSVTIPVGGLF